MNITTTFSNPRTEAMIEDWPFGRQRCRAHFKIESGKRGERVVRLTENKTRTGWNKPKKTTYANTFVIVDGDDERTYLLAHNGNGITVWSGDMKHVVASVYAPGALGGDPDVPTRYAELCALIADRDPK